MSKRPVYSGACAIIYHHQIRRCCLNRTICLNLKGVFGWWKEMKFLYLFFELKLLCVLLFLQGFFLFFALFEDHIRHKQKPFLYYHMHRDFLWKFLICYHQYDIHF